MEICYFRSDVKGIIGRISTSFSTSVMQAFASTSEIVGTAAESCLAGPLFGLLRLGRSVRVVTNAVPLIYCSHFSLCSPVRCYALRKLVCLLKYFCLLKY